MSRLIRPFTIPFRIYSTSFVHKRPCFSYSTMSTPIKTPVLTSKAPKPLPGVYNQAIVAGGLVYCSGAVPMDPETMEIVDGDIEVHTHQCIKNLTAVLEEAGTTIDHVVKVNVFLANMDDFAKMNEVYSIYWGGGRLIVSDCFHVS